MQVHIHNPAGATEEELAPAEAGLILEDDRIRDLSRRGFDSKELREWELEELRAWAAAAGQHQKFPWLHGIVLVTEQKSDSTAVELLESGIVVLEIPEGCLDKELVIREFLRGLQSMPKRAMLGQTSGNPELEDNQQQSEFSKKPAYFDKEHYDKWVEQLAQEWKPDDAFDSES